MTTNISSVPGRALVLTELTFPTLTNIAIRLWAMVNPQFKSGSRAQEAIEVFRDASASPDMCDWAERYLCGMEDANAKRYCGGRRWQS